jgi:NAD(P)-dependent dehydrogenase (short-subunit alcohol dehydrogenase family)
VESIHPEGTPSGVLVACAATTALFPRVAAAAGASKGIGAAIAKSLSAAGAAIVVNYSSSKEGAASVVADITGNGGKLNLSRASSPRAPTCGFF